MSISFGNKNIPQIYFGSIPVKEVYFGSSLVWKRGGADAPDIPDEPITATIELGINYFERTHMEEWNICCQTSSGIESQSLQEPSFPIYFYPEIGEEVTLYFTDNDGNKITDAAFSFTGKEIDTNNDHPGQNFYEFSFTMDSDLKSIDITRYWAVTGELLITQNILNYIENNYFSSPKILCYDSNGNFDTYYVQEGQSTLASYFQWDIDSGVVNLNNYEKYSHFELWDEYDGNNGTSLTVSTMEKNNGYYYYRAVILNI